MNDSNGCRIFTSAGGQRVGNFRFWLPQREVEMANVFYVNGSSASAELARGRAVGARSDLAIEIYVRLCFQ